MLWVVTPNTVACVKGIISHICKIFTQFLHIGASGVLGVGMKNE